MIKIMNIENTEIKDILTRDINLETGVEDIVSGVIKNVAKGACWIDSNVAHLALKLFPKPENTEIMQNSHNQDTKTRLTERENEVLKLLVQGKSNTQIAQELIVSVHTAKAHVCSILQKLCVDDRVQAAVKAIKEGIVSV